MCLPGKLFAAMHRADAEGLIRFIFPVERLPGHTQVNDIWHIVHTGVGVAHNSHKCGSSIQGPGLSAGGLGFLKLLIDTQSERVSE